MRCQIPGCKKKAVICSTHAEIINGVCSECEIHTCSEHNVEKDQNACLKIYGKVSAVAQMVNPFVDVKAAKKF